MAALARLYDLTAAESRVTELLKEGEPWQQRRTACGSASI